MQLRIRKKAIECKWVYILKHSPNRAVERLKARLLAKRYAQSYGVDYFETFSFITKPNSLRVVTSIVAKLAYVSIEC